MRFFPRLWFIYTYQTVVRTLQLVLPSKNVHVIYRTTEIDKKVSIYGKVFDYCKKRSKKNVFHQIVLKLSFYEGRRWMSHEYNNDRYLTLFCFTSVHPTCIC